jgi:hypothetical protein
MSTKGEWPEAVGLSGEAAKEKVLHDDPNANVQVMPENSPCTRDYRLNRVRIFVNADGVVVSPPRRG